MTNADLDKSDVAESISSAGDLKSGIVPIFKGGYRTLSCNVRPISLASILLKDLKKIGGEVVSSLVANSLLKPSEYGLGRREHVSLVYQLDVQQTWT